MFFCISKESKQNFPNHYKVGPFTINTDAGWKTIQTNNRTVIYKGYADQFNLDHKILSIVEQTEPNFLGSFCAIVADNNSLEIKTDRYRSFPIYYDTEVTNLAQLTNTAWTDSLVSVDANFTVTEKKFDVLGSVDPAPITEQELIDTVIDRLNQKVKDFVTQNQLPIKVFLSGGVDTMLVYSFLQQHTDRIELVRCQHIDYDYFWIKNSGTLENAWAYRQIHHWNDPCVLMSGTPGDEFMLRSPNTVNQWSKHHGLDILDLMETRPWSNCYHREYFLKPDNKKIFQEPGAKEVTPLYLCNINVNDWQHQHLGNTLTWTPLRDLEIFKLFLRLPIEAALGQILDSSISIKIIEQNCPGLSQFLSDKKNYGNVLSNLSGLILK